MEYLYWILTVVTLLRNDVLCHCEKCMAFCGNPGINAFTGFPRYVLLRSE